MKMLRRDRIRGFLWFGMLICGVLTADPGLGQEKFPSKPITLLIPWSPGGGHDLTARALQPHMEKILGQPVVVINKPGGGATIGFSEVRTSPPDGYMVGTISPTLNIVKFTMPKANVSYDQFEPIAYVGYTPLGILTRKEATWNTLKEVLAYAKANPEKLRVGNAGYGGNYHISAIGMEQAAGVKFTHIPFKGAAPTVPAVLGGHVDVIVSGIGDTLHLIRGGSLKVLGLAAPERSKFAPQAQTFKELGLDVEFVTFFAYIGPRGIPRERVNILYEAFKRSAETKEVTSFFDSQGISGFMRSPKELGEFLKKEDQKWDRLIKIGGIKPE